MQFVPKTVNGLAPFIMIMFVLLAIMFTQQYGWFDWTKWLTKKSTEG